MGSFCATTNKTTPAHAVADWLISWARDWLTETVHGSGSPALGEIADAARELLERVVAAPPRASDDWSIPWTSPGGDDPDLLAEFLNAPSRQTFAWPLAAPRRRSIHYLIEDAGLPVTHTTRREGRPYALVLTKTKALHTRAREARRRAEQDLAWLQTSWPR